MKETNPIVKNILSPDRIRVNLDIKSKKKALDLIAELFQHATGLKHHTIFEALSSREKMGSTGLERGIALPHCRVNGCKEPLAALITLQQGIDFESRDNEPTDLLWALIVPDEAAEEHVSLLAAVSSILIEPDNCRYIRNATEPDKLYKKLIENE